MKLVPLVACAALAVTSAVVSPASAAPLTTVRPHAPIVLLRPGGATHRTRVHAAPHANAAVSIQGIRATLTAGGINVTGTPQAGSWSTVLTPGHLDYKSGSVSLETEMGGNLEVQSSYAYYQNTGTVTITADGLKPGGVYVAACVIQFETNVPQEVPVKVTIGDQQTTVNSNGAIFNASVPFIAPPGGATYIIVRPEWAFGWWWTQCTVGTAA